MNILILEDNKSRIEMFRKNLGGAESEIHVTENVDICISLLKNEKWDVLFLDHDLGGHVFVPSKGEEKTGWHVARFLNENKELQPKIIIIHSLNSAGAKAMFNELPNAEIVPFAWQKVTLTSRKSYAPWDEEQVDALREKEKQSPKPKFKCEKCDGFSWPEKHGLVCSRCNNIQMWCHEEDLV